MSGHTRIEFVQSGGFAGLVKGCRIDTACLGADERRQLQSLVDGCGLTASGERFSAAGRDLRQYEITIDGSGSCVRWVCDEKCLPPSARPLVDFLVARATPQPLQGRPAAQPEEWGRFEGSVVARWGDDGRDMTLVEPFAYVDPHAARWDAPAGSVVNGASIPRAFWSLIGGPFEGKFRNASVVHDVACETREQPWQRVHRMFYEACRCGGVAVAKAKMMYYAVYHFGPRWSGSGPQLRDETPPPPTPEQVLAIERYFATHDAEEAAIPTLVMPRSGGGEP